MFDEEFQYQENSIDLILKFSSQTEHLSNKEEHYTPLSNKDSVPTAPLIPPMNDILVPDLAQQGYSEERQLKRIRNACNQQEEMLKQMTKTGEKYLSKGSMHRSFPKDNQKSNISGARLKAKKIRKIQN